ncbi:MAG: hypothetical protein ACRYG7_13525 [Janthinobacterium lividum]
MLKVLFVVGGLAVAALGSVAWIFSLGQRSVSYVLHLTVRDAQGQPLSAQPVVIWQRDYPAQQLQFDGAGQLSVLAAESFGASAFTGPSRPDAFAIRLQLPEVSPLFYSFGVARTGPLGPYQVYNGSYSANDTQWVGDFDATGRVRRPIKPDPTGAPHSGVAPLGGKVLRWLGTATLQRAANTADGHRQYTVALVLQQQGEELFERT